MCCDGSFGKIRRGKWVKQQHRAYNHHQFGIGEMLINDLDAVHKFNSGIPQKGNVVLHFDDHEAETNQRRTE